jgi:hypothetical protein
MSHIRIGNQVNWRGKYGTGPVEEVTIIGDGMECGEIVYDLDNGHWAYGYQLTNRAMDRALEKFADLYAKWDAESPGATARFFGTKVAIMDGKVRGDSL